MFGYSSSPSISACSSGMFTDEGSGAHLVIYLKIDQGIEIIRILHAHQSLTAYLTDS